MTSAHSASISDNGLGLSIEYKSIADLKPYSHNARTHTKHQIRQISESVRAFGFTNPILIDSHNRIVAGHGRVEAAKLLKMEQVPTIRLEGLTDDQIRAYILADNKLAENAGWDRSILSIELQHLMALDCAELNVSVTGFEIAEIDLIIEEAKAESSPEEAPLEPSIDQASVTKPGDLWILGRHRVTCGNSLSRETFETLMGQHRATMVFTDPPSRKARGDHRPGPMEPSAGASSWEPPGQAA